MKNWKNILIKSLWIIGAGLLMTLFVFAWKGKAEKKCNAIQIELTGDTNGFLFMDEKEILKFINDKGVTVGKPIIDINLIQLEKQLNEIKWVEHTNIYFDNLQQLQVKIEQRIPVARVFTVSGNSFFIDKTATKLPLRQLSVMRLPVFTGFPSDQEMLSKPDSVLLNDILHFSLVVQQDSFFLAQISQINIAPNGDFEMIPSLGDHTVLFGSIENLEDKLNRLYTFYKRVWPSAGINAYQLLDLRFDHQLVALKKGMQPIQYSNGLLPDLRPINFSDSTIVDSLQTKVPAIITKVEVKVDSVSKKVITPKNSKTSKPKTAQPKLKKIVNKLNNKPVKNTLKVEKKSAKAEMPKKKSSNNN